MSFDVLKKLNGMVQQDTCPISLEDTLLAVVEMDTGPYSALWLKWTRVLIVSKAHSCNEQLSRSFR